MPNESDCFWARYQSAVGRLQISPSLEIMFKFRSRLKHRHSVHSLRSAHGCALAVPSAPRSDPHQGRALACKSWLCGFAPAPAGRSKGRRQGDVNGQFLNLGSSARTVIVTIPAIFAQPMLLLRASNKRFSSLQLPSCRPLFV